MTDFALEMLLGGALPTFLICSTVALTHSLVKCGGGKDKANKKKKKKSKTNGKEKTGASAGTPENEGNENESDGAPKVKPPTKQGGVADTYDPNYQTLCGMDQKQTFGDDKANVNKQSGPVVSPAAANAGPKAPAVGGIAATHDPNYQTLCGMDGGQVFGGDKAGGAAAPVPAANAGPKAPAVGGIAQTHDPNYQTLAGMDGAVFGADKKGF